MRARSAAALACLAAVAVGCGGDDDGQRAQRALRAVELKVTAPADMATIEAEGVEVLGTVEPANAAVWVMGQRAAVSGGGTFSARVPLEPGANVIDVAATARGRGPAVTAFRVNREVPVEVPDLGGKEVAEAENALADLGLKAAIIDETGAFDELLFGDDEPTVCEQDPEPGSEVKRGTTVDLVVSKRC